MTSTTTNPFDGKAFAELFSEYKAAFNNVNCLDDDTEVNSEATRMYQIEEAIWATPAADTAEAHLKLEIASRDHPHSLIPEHALQSVLDDTRRLLTGGASPLFDPKLWLALWTQDGGGYAVSCDQLNIVKPATVLPRTVELLAEIEQANNRDVLKAYILNRDDSEAGEPNDWQGLCNALETATANANQPSDDETCDRNADIQLKAVQALMLHPAKDMAAFAHKMEKFAEHDCGSYSDQIKDPIIATLLADTKRLANIA